MSERMARFLRGCFWLLNKCFMVPIFRLGLGPLFGSPYGGYVMVIKNTGHKSGKLRYTPVNYAIVDDCIYCAAGFGKAAHWYRNILASPHVELVLPGGAIAARGEAIELDVKSLAILRQIMKNSGFAAFLFGGFNPFTMSDERLRQVTGDCILLRFTPTGIGNGAWDHGGWGWIGVLAVLIALVWLLLGN